MLDGERLNGWKAIGNFLGRERTTAIRWAKERGLPVHRVPGGRTGTVFALRTELDEWLASDDKSARHMIEPIATADPVARFASTTIDVRRWLPVALAGIAAIGLAALAMSGTAPSSAKVPITIAVVASSTAAPATIEFGRALSADLARFANASANLAVFEREPGAVPGTHYAVRTEIERADGKLMVHARLVAVDNGAILWTQRFEQSGPALSALRERVAANVIGVLRCSFGGLEAERPKVGPADLVYIMSVCQAAESSDWTTVQAHARQLTAQQPDVALGWAMLAIAESNLIADGETSLHRQARAHARRAFEIAPESVATTIARAAVTARGSAEAEALVIVDNALKTHPDHPWLLNWRSVILFNLGYVQASVAPAMASYRGEPSSLKSRDVAVRRLAASGRVTEALSLQDENERLWPGHPSAMAMRARIVVDVSAHRAADHDTISKYEHEVSANPYVAYMLARLHERTGNRRAALDWLARAPVDNAHHQWSLLFWPDAAGLRSEPAFFRKMAQLGLVHSWVARKQWPDFCAEPRLNYDCAVEASKLGPVRAKS
ncbi:MAG: hypothetical protein ACKVOP_08850 [Sphingomonadaceae bacterium]